MNGRKAAFLALLQEEKDGTFLDVTLSQCALEKKELALAHELAAGTLRMRRLLSETIQTTFSLPKKKKERILLFLALYQHLFLSKIPSYAIGDEMMELAKSCCNPRFLPFFNHFLRNMPSEALEGSFSYTDFFINTLIQSYGEEQAKKILSIQNTKPTLFARKRTEKQLLFEEVYTLENFIHSSQYYVQNKTQAEIVFSLLEKITTPQSICDLCAAPGGKTLLAHDFFPESSIHVNEPSKRRLKLLEENLHKYNIQASFSSQKGEDFIPKSTFDLVLVDAPCSSSGVLFKSPEARWKIEEDIIKKLAEKQLAILQSAKKIVSPNGHILFTSCSILPQETQDVVSKSGLHCIDSKLTLPLDREHEGGFGALLK